MRVLVTGSRDWPNREAVYRALDEVAIEFDLNYEPDEYGNTMPNPLKMVVVHGKCPTGADHFADQWCVGNFFIGEEHPADWKKFGKAAGFIRNTAMVSLGADLCLAFIFNKSRGATHTANLAERNGIPTRREIR